MPSSPDALFNGVSLVILEISVQFLQFEQSLFPGGLGPGRIQGRRNDTALRYRVWHTLHFPYQNNNNRYIITKDTGNFFLSDFRELSDGTCSRQSTLICENINKHRSKEHFENTSDINVKVYVGYLYWYGQCNVLGTKGCHIF